MRPVVEILDRRILDSEGELERRVSPRRTKNPDFLLIERKGLAAVYIIGEGILNKEKRRLLGIPFLFYTEKTSPDLLPGIEDLTKSGVEYLGPGEFERLMRNSHKIFERRSSEYKFTAMHERAIGWIVPYFFDSYHKISIRENKKIRSKEDFLNLMDFVTGELLYERARGTARIPNTEYADRTFLPPDKLVYITRP